MKRIAKLSGYGLRFHPSRPFAFTMPNASEVSVVSTVDWKPVGKLAKLKYPRELCFTEDAIVVSGIEGHIGVFELKDFACRVFFKPKNASNDNWGLFVHGVDEQLGLTAFYDGVLWVNYGTKETRFCFQPTDEFGFGPYTRYVCQGATADQLVTLCGYSILIKDQPSTRSMAHVWSVHQESPLKSFDVLPKPSQKEYGRQCCVGMDNTLIVANNFGNRLLGCNLDSGEIVFDNPKLSHGGQSCEIVYAVLPKRRLIAVGSNGYIDFWNSDLSKLVFQYDTGMRDGFNGELTVSADEKYLACGMNGKLSVFEIPDELQGT